MAENYASLKRGKAGNFSPYALEGKKKERKRTKSFSGIIKKKTNIKRRKVIRGGSTSR